MSNKADEVLGRLNRGVKFEIIQRFLKGDGIRIEDTLDRLEIVLSLFALAKHLKDMKQNPIKHSNDEMKAAEDLLTYTYEMATIKGFGKKKELNV